MEYHLKEALGDMMKRDERGINYIYSKTYNYVYLRAKSILRRDEDVLRLTRDVYLQMLSHMPEINEANLYEWLGKCTYILGCGYYKKKKAREDKILDINESDFNAHRIDDPEAAADIIAENLENLPDLHQAAFYAFFYDYMDIDAIAEVMGETCGAVINFLNYTRRYMVKALENEREENAIQVFFSIEAACLSLRKWSNEHCLPITNAQTVYNELCEEAGIDPGQISMERKDFAGVGYSVVRHRPDDYAQLADMMRPYGKEKIKSRNVIIIAVAAAVILAIVIVAVASCHKKDAKKEQKDPKPQVTDTAPQDEDEEGASSDAADPSEYVIPDSDTRLLTRQELEILSKEDLRLARNEIFARHGVTFSGDLGAYFSSKSWYHPTVSLDDFYNGSGFSSIEEANVSLILSVEATK